MSPGARAGGRSFLYCRVSGAAQERDGWSLDGQRDRGLAWYRAAGLPEPEIRIEVESAGEERIERRVELHRLIRDARPGDVIAVAVLDRWSRHIVFGVQSVRALVRAGIGWHAIHEGIDASTPEGDSQLGLRMWLAEEELKRIRARTLGRAEELLAAGLWAYGTTPYGYARGDRRARRHLHLELHPERAPVVVEWHERLARGESLRAVAAWLRAYPGAPHHAPTLRDITRRRIYLGEVWCRGEWVRGQHPAIVPLELWERAQAAITERRTYGRGPRGESTAGCLLRGLLRCALCGRRCGVVVARPDGREGGAWLYYLCAGRRRGEPCEGPYARADALDAAAAEAVLGRLGELRGILAARAGPKRGTETPRPSMDPVAARARIESRLARAVALAVDERITAAELATQRARLREELAAVERREAAEERAVRAADPGRRGDLARALADVRGAWRGLDVAGRRRVVELLGRVALGADGALRWTWRGMEELVAG